MTSFASALKAGHTSTEEALAIFDALDPVDTDFMLGAWKGEGFPTNHPLDGVLEAYRWHGKRFESTEHVHPLVFDTLGGKTASVNPLLMLPTLGLLGRMSVPRSNAAGRTFQALIPLMSTRASRARLRMTTYRGKSSATMIYDSLPINDVFRRVDDNTVMGVMDLKGVKQPFFFVLRRETAA
ncbi:MAG: DUF4334 domain-containing protein [Pseudomonadota bacterium]